MKDYYVTLYITHANNRQRYIWCGDMGWVPEPDCEYNLFKYVNLLSYEDAYKLKEQMGVWIKNVDALDLGIVERQQRKVYYLTELMERLVDAAAEIAIKEVKGISI